MNKGRVNIIAAAVAALVLAGCSTTPQSVYPAGTPIMSAADAKAMIRVEVKELRPVDDEPVIVAALD